MTHLNLETRYQLFALKESGMNQKKISKLISKSESTVSRELKRNSKNGKYLADEANIAALLRRKHSGGKSKLTEKNVRLIESCVSENQWSPEQISGWLKKDKNILISTECIYQHIARDREAGGRLYLHCRRKGKKYNKRRGSHAGRGHIPGRVDIDERPKIVDEKSRLGDFELDTIVGAKHQGAILSIVERKSKLTKLVLLKRGTAKSVAEALIAALSPMKDHVFTLTSDNGKEFAEHKIVAKELDAQFFFAKPYHAWERGLNENTNGLVRQFFTKGSSFAKLTDEDVFIVEEKLNNRPRKLLNFSTPREVFLSLANPIKKIAFDT